MNALTLETLRAYDPDAPMPQSSTRWRFRCPQPECMGKTGRTFDLDWGQQLFCCHRCGARGKLGGSFKVDREALAKAHKDEAKRKKAMWRQAVMVSLSGTDGQRYLESRGIGASVLRGSHVRYCFSFFGRPAVMFEVKDNAGTVVALQGRYIESDADPKTRTIGSASKGVFATRGAWDARRIVITEAPIDALSLLLLGMPAMATLGTRLPDWMPQAVKGRSVLIATDADAAGDEAAEKWRAKLKHTAASIERLRPSGSKDWNEMICRG